MELLALLGKTLLLRPYVFIFLAIALAASAWLMGTRRTVIFFLLTYITAFLCEFSSTRTGIPFGWYFYTGATRGQELYLSNVPFMDSLSFSFLLFTSYCLALLFLLPAHGHGLKTTIRDDQTIRTSGFTLALTALFFVLLDVIIDPVALRGDRWFLGKIYYYPEPGMHFGVPMTNYLGWAVVGLVAFGLYQRIDRRLPNGASTENIAGKLVLGCALYYGIIGFNLAVTFWIDEALLGATGIVLYLPITAFLLLKLTGRLPVPAAKRMTDSQPTSIMTPPFNRL
jgi:putative membrane protein